MTITRSSNKQYINVTGDTADVFGHYKLSGIFMQSKENFHFNNITFLKVYFQFDRKSDEKYFLKASRLNVDFTTLSNLWNQKIEVIPPPLKTDISAAEQSDISVYCRLLAKRAF